MVIFVRDGPHALYTVQMLPCGHIRRVLIGGTYLGGGQGGLFSVGSLLSPIVALFVERVRRQCTVRALVMHVRHSEERVNIWECV
jgi:hypothetical protein